LQSLNLPAALEVVEKPEGLPPSIKEKSSEIKQDGGIDRLYDEISTVEELSEQVSSILEEVTEIWSICLLSLITLSITLLTSLIYIGFGNIGSRSSS